MAQFGELGEAWIVVVYFGAQRELLFDDFNEGDSRNHPVFLIGDAEDR